MFRELALMLSLLPSPVFADAEPGATNANQCNMMSSNQSCTALLADLSRKDICTAHAVGYYNGVIAVGDELFFSLPQQVSWDNLMVIYGTFVVSRQDLASRKAYFCIIASLAQQFPMPKEEANAASE